MVYNTLQGKLLAWLKATPPPPPPEDCSSDHRAEIIPHETT